MPKIRCINRPGEILLDPIPIGYLVTIKEETGKKWKVKVPSMCLTWGAIHQAGNLAFPDYPWTGTVPVGGVSFKEYYE